VRLPNGKAGERLSLRQSNISNKMQARLVNRNNIDAAAWNSLVDESPEGSVFLYTYYIDALFGEDWQGIIVQDEDKLCGIMPLRIRKKFIFNYALQPYFTRHWGLCLARQVFKNTYEEYSWKKKVTDAAISAIPAGLAAFEYTFHPSFDYTLPFHIKGYDLGLRYTFQLDISPKPEEILANFQPNARRNVNKAIKEGKEIKVNSLSPEEVAEYMRKDAAASRILDDQAFRQLKNLVAEGLKCNFLYTISVYSASGELECFAILLFDRCCTYLLAHYQNPIYKSTDPVTFLIYHCFLKARENTTNWDFLGSMLEGIEGFNRRFGAKPVPYITVSRYHKLVKALK
jgi:hypothetical protein